MLVRTDIDWTKSNKGCDDRQRNTNTFDRFTSLEMILDHPYFGNAL